MGSFNVVCSISHISINSGDPIVLIPLEVSKYPTAKIGDNNLFLLYCHAFYSPACFPLKGEYDDYGGIEYIEKDESLEFAEEWYKVPIEKIWETRENIEEHPKNITTGMFIHREVYEMLINTQIDDLGRKKIGQFLLRNKLSLEYDYSAACEEIIKQKKNYDEMNFPEDLYGHNLNHPFQFRESETMFKMSYHCLLNKIMKDSLINLVLLQDGMFSVNSFYFPAMSGYQFGNHYMSKKLYQTANRVVTEKIKRYKLK
jgi:hypothetical protein